VESESTLCLTFAQRFSKRLLDVIVSAIGILLLWPVILIGWIAAAISTKANGFFVHQRIGKNGKLFPMLKLRSMKEVAGVTTCITTDNDVRITKTGRILRKLKIDELPQLFNVFVGQMSLVGPRPDMPGYADALTGESRAVLALRPGITGPATLAFRNEDELLATVQDPETYNDHVIWPAKVRMNVDYIRNYSLAGDIKFILQTVFGGSELARLDDNEVVRGEQQS
jgi:lipopolysaccharide/colanic/teichoic acid biosynthesis glycosyltransferase